MTELNARLREHLHFHIWKDRLPGSSVTASLCKKFRGWPFDRTFLVCFCAYSLFCINLQMSCYVYFAGENRESRFGNYRNRFESSLPALDSRERQIPLFHTSGDDLSKPPRCHITVYIKICNYNLNYFEYLNQLTC